MTSYDKSNLCALFDSIAKRYDLGNDLLSFHLHRLWNRRLANYLAKSSPQRVSDLCCGTGEIARRLHKCLPQSEFFLVDFSSEMLEIAKKNIKTPTVQFFQADIHHLPFASDTFDATSIAYGIRNVQDRMTCFREIYRTLKPGGILGIVELTRPKRRLLSFLHRLYLRTFVPLIGKLTTSNEAAYNYLCQSIETFITPETLFQELTEAGFSHIEIRPQTFGIATLFFAIKT